MISLKSPVEFPLPGFWSQGMQVESVRMKHSSISFECQHSEQSAELHAHLQVMEFASCPFQNSLPHPAAVGTGNCLSQQTIWPAQQTTLLWGGRHWAGLALLLSEILHLCFPSAVGFSCWVVSTSGVFFTPCSQSQQCGPLCCRMAGARDRWQEHFCWGGWQGRYGWGALQS